MPTKLLSLYPWSGGLQVSVDPIIADPQQLTQADNIQFTNSGSRRKRGGQVYFNPITFKQSGSTNMAKMIYAYDAWSYTTAGKRSALVAVGENLTPTATTPIYYGVNWSTASSTLYTNRNTSANFIARHGYVTGTVMTEDMFLGLRQDGTVANTIRYWNNMSSSANFVAMTASTGTLPAGWILKAFRGRLFIAGVKGNLDKLYYSTVGNPFAWASSSGNIDIGVPGDGDPSGITAIFPGVGSDASLYVAKQKSLYRVNVSDPSPNNWSVDVISQGVGCINPNAVCAVDQSDVMFCSDRGVHTLAQVLGGTAYQPAQFISADIHEDYQQFIDTSARDRITLTWFAPLNSVLMSCRTEASAFNTIYGFNVQVKQWFRWRQTPCNFLMTRFDGTNKVDRLYAAADNGRINELNQDARYDFVNSATGAINTVLRSTVIYPEKLPYQEQNFLNLGFVFRSRDTSSFRVQYKIDDMNVTPSLTYNQKYVGGNILGSSTLGVNFILGNIAGTGIRPVWNHIKGVGNSIEVTITHNTVNKDFELFGMMLEFDSAGQSQNAQRKF